MTSMSSRGVWIKLKSGGRIELVQACRFLDWYCEKYRLSPYTILDNSGMFKPGSDVQFKFRISIGTRTFDGPASPSPLHAARQAVLVAVDALSTVQPEIWFTWRQEQRSGATLRIGVPQYTPNVPLDAETVDFREQSKIAEAADKASRILVVATSTFGDEALKSRLALTTLKMGHEDEKKKLESEVWRLERKGEVLSDKCVGLGNDLKVLQARVQELEKEDETKTKALEKMASDLAARTPDTGAELESLQETHKHVVLERTALKEERNEMAEYLAKSRDEVETLRCQLARSEERVQQLEKEEERRARENTYAPVSPSEFETASETASDSSLEQLLDAASPITQTMPQSEVVEELARLKLRLDILEARHSA